MSIPTYTIGALVEQNHKAIKSIENTRLGLLSWSILSVGLNIVLIQFLSIRFFTTMGFKEYLAFAALAISAPVTGYFAYKIRPNAQRIATRLNTLTEKQLFYLVLLVVMASTILNRSFLLYVFWMLFVCIYMIGVAILPLAKVETVYIAVDPEDSV